MCSNSAALLNTPISSLEHSIDTDEGRLRPDAIVRIPGQKSLIIDAKVSLNAYQDAFEAQDDADP
jgi:DNA recombination protein RmuC